MTGAVIPGKRGKNWTAKIEWRDGLQVITPIKMPPSYIIRIPYVEFQVNFCDDKMTSQFNRHVDDDGLIEIEYHYGPVVNMKTEICWRTPNGGDFQKVRYGHSSPFAMWWCSLTDETEDDDDEQEGTGYSCKECGECGPHIIVESLAPVSFICPECKEAQFMKDMMSAVTRGARECGATLE